MVKSYLPRSLYNPFSNLQLQSRLPGASQHQSCFAVRPCHCVLSQPVANAYSRSVPPNRPTFAQRWHWGLDNWAQIWRRSDPPSFLRLLRKTKISLSSRAYFAGLSRPPLQKVPRPRQFAILKCKIVQTKLLLQSCALFVDDFPRSSPERHQKPWKQRAYTSATAEATLPAHAFPNCCTSQLLDDGWLTWWCGWHDGGNGNHDKPPEFGS